MVGVKRGGYDCVCGQARWFTIGTPVVTLNGWRWNYRRAELSMVFFALWDMSGQNVLKFRISGRFTRGHECLVSASFRGKRAMMCLLKKENIYPY